MCPMCPIWAHFRAQSWAHLKSYFICLTVLRYFCSVLRYLTRDMEVCASIPCKRILKDKSTYGPNPHTHRHANAQTDMLLTLSFHSS